MPYRFFNLWNLQLAKDGRSCRFDITVAEFRTLNRGTQELFDECLRVWKLPTSAESWQLEPFASSYFRDADTTPPAAFDDLYVMAWRARVQLRDAVTQTLNEVEALGNQTLGAYDLTAPEGRPRDAWGDRSIVLLGHVFGEKPKVRQIAAAMELPASSVEITRVGRAAHEVWVDLGPTHFPDDAQRIVSAEERFRELVPAVRWFRSAGYLGLRSVGDLELAENFLRKR
jgi:hypothetical protein